MSATDGEKCIKCGKILVSSEKKSGLCRLCTLQRNLAVKREIVRYMTAGLTHLKKGNYLEADMDFQRVVELNPTDSKISYLLYVTNHELGRNSQANKYFKKAVKKDHKFHDLVNIVELLIALDCYKEAYDCVSKILQKHPEHKAANRLRNKISDAAIIE